MDGHKTTWAIYAVHPIHPGTLTRSSEPIAEIPRPDNDERGLSEADANARLIAAAPEMLAALKAICDSGNIDHGCQWTIDRADIDLAKAAISKAVGEEVKS